MLQNLLLDQIKAFSPSDENLEVMSPAKLAQALAPLIIFESMSRELTFTYSSYRFELCPSPHGDSIMKTGR